MSRATTTFSRAALTTAALTFGAVRPGPAEVVFDGTMGPTGTLAGNFQIPDTSGRQVGPNLFHSFTTFNVNTNESATFTSTFTGPTSNVIGRVTGGGPSTIDGLLASAIPNASVWLINPNGIVFGASASIDVAGGFHASTADYLGFDDGGRFHATQPGNTVLSVANPTAFGFLDANIGTITADAATLEVPAGQALSLVGGDITLNGTTLSAPGGRIDLAGARGAGEITLEAEGIGVGQMTSFGDVRLQAAEVLTTAATSGDIYIRGGELVVDGTSYVTADTQAGDPAAPPGDIVIDAADVSILNASQIAASTDGAGDGGDVTVKASGGFTVAGADASNTPAGIFANSHADATGDAGSIRIAADNFVMNAGSNITSIAFGDGNAGDIAIDVTGDFAMLSTSGAFDSQLLVNALGAGNSGTLQVDAANVTLDNGALIQAENADGSPGRLTVNARSVSLTGGSQMSTSTSGSSPGGALTVNATDVALRGYYATSNAFYNTGLYATTGAPGAGGRITVNADTLALDDNGGIFANTFGPGDAGDIALHTRTLDISGDAFVSSGTFGTGNGGNVTVEATAGLHIAGLAPYYTGIFTNSYWAGDAGSITVTTPELSIVDGGFIQSGSFASDPLQTGAGGNIALNVDSLNIDGGFVSTRTETSGNGGNIVVDASDTVTLQDSSGLAFGGAPIGGLLVSAGGIRNSPDATGAAGSITVDSGKLVIRDGGAISADTFLTGDAGDITVNADSIDILGETSVYTGIFNSSASAGHGGSIRLTGSSIGIAGMASLTAGAFGTGDAGTIALTGDNVSVTSGGSIISKTFGPGAGGEIGVTADTISLAGGTLSADTTGSGPGGNIVLRGREVEVSGGGSVSASATDLGDAGTIEVNADDSLNVTGGSIETSAAGSAGGNINLNVGRTLFLDGGLVSAAAAGVTSTDDGGNVTVDPNLVVLHESGISASANAGNGGNIYIHAGTFVIDAPSTIDASSRTGLDGDVSIDSPNQVTDEVAVLALPSAEVPALAAQRCLPQLGAERSTLLAEASGGTGANPADYLSSPAARAPDAAAAPAARAPAGAVAAADPESTPTCYENADASNR